MNIIKRIMMSVAILLSTSIVLASCGNDSPSASESPNTQNEPEASYNNEETVKVSELENKEFLDSIATINAKVESLSKKIDEQSKSNSQFETDLKKYQQRYSVLILIVFTIGTISLIMAIVAFVKVAKTKKSSSRHRDEIEQLKALIYKLDLWIQNQSSQKVTSSGNNQLSTRLTTLEKQISKLGTLAQQTANINSPVVSDDNVVKDTKTGYFGMPSKMSETSAYFKCILGSRSDSEARFIAKINGDTAEFEPLEGQACLNDFKTSHSLKLAFDHSGCVLPIEANSFTVITPGVAKLEESRWIITKKAKIVFRS